MDVDAESFARFRVLHAHQAVQTTDSRLDVTADADRATFDMWGDLMRFRWGMRGRRRHR